MDLINKISSTEKSLDEIVEKAKDWALLHGFTMRIKEDLADHHEFLPFTLLPSCFPRKEYENVYSIQPIINRLIHRISYDTDFLLESLKETIKVDEYTNRLVNIYKDTLIDHNTEIASLGLLRSDFMLDVEKNITLNEDRWMNARCKQVEVNTIASSQGWMGGICSQFHRYILKELDLGYYAINLPENNPMNGLCLAILEAWKIYDKQSAAILLIDEKIRFIADMRNHEYHLQKLNPDIRILHRELNQMYKSAKLEGPENRLLIDDHEIAVVYFRGAFSPKHYKGEEDWNVRLLIERSRAIKCPTVGYQLAGTKKVQEILARPGCLERFLDKDECNMLRKVFTGQYSLDNNSAIISTALKNPEKFVLKPQREGGTNNYFNEELRIKLQNLQDKDERFGWILMDKIESPTIKNYLVRSGDRKFAHVNSELGIFGAVLGDKNKIFFNHVPGHAMRTKLAESDEVAIAAGFGYCDSPLLI